LAAAALAQETAPALPNGLYAIFSTSMGHFTARLYEKDTPITVANFVALAQGAKAWRDPKTRAMVKRPLYDNITFHRVLHGQMIQSGSADGTTSHNCGVTVRDEFLPGLRFDRPGKLAMANTGDPDSGGCQFFITTGPILQWNGKYSIFGVVVEGLDVVDKIDRAPCRGDQPIDPVKLIGVTIERIGPEPAHKPQKPKEN
jgi:cyclophilin family peptidyl-prolyl cis-trans isomerase